MPTRLTVLGGDERHAIGRDAAFAQTLGGLGKAARAERGIEQRLARRDIGPPFLTDRDHRPYDSA